MSPHSSSAKDKPNVGKESFADVLIFWQRHQGRHNLPWQGTRDPYRIWLSEVMLQQTQVTTVIPYYTRFLERFPDVTSLAAAPVAEVMALWSGLGYYSRARNLHRCAQQVLADHGGNFPTDPALLEKLPGIGRSTASAIAVFASGAIAPILDGNVKRVLTRVFGIEGYPGEKSVEQTLWLLAESLLPEKNVEAYTQGLMDLGATLCSRTKPLCASCPMNALCVARATNRTSELPTRKATAPIPQRQVAMLVIVHRKQILLEQRPDAGIWGGLLSLPEVDSDELKRIRRAAAKFGKVDACEALSSFSHTFTHFKLQIHPYAISLKQRKPLDKSAPFAWHKLENLEKLGLPAPVKKLLQKLV
ncbi:MAG: A/G-specific adenine glycosylase [Oxalobacter sp.]|nr:MAG: A/G-specific adenine glycosylase [Oxalobacter sp.]